MFVRDAKAVSTFTKCDLNSDWSFPVLFLRAMRSLGRSSASRAGLPEDWRLDWSPRLRREARSQQRKSSDILPAYRFTIRPPCAIKAARQRGPGTLSLLEASSWWPCVLKAQAPVSRRVQVTRVILSHLLGLVPKLNERCASSRLFAQETRASFPSLYVTVP